MAVLVIPPPVPQSPSNGHRQAQQLTRFWRRSATLKLAGVCVAVLGHGRFAYARVCFERCI